MTPYTSAASLGSMGTREAVSPAAEAPYPTTGTQQEVVALAAALESVLLFLRAHRALVAYLAYALASLFSLGTAYLIRHDLAVPSALHGGMVLQGAVLVILRLALAHRVRLMCARWRYVGMDDAFRLGAAATGASLCFVLLSWGVPWTPPLALSVALVEWAVFVLGVAGVWVLYRKGYETLAGPRPRTLRTRTGDTGVPPPRGGILRLVIVGAGESGNILAREVRRMPDRFDLVGFLDDDPAKIGTRSHGVKVLGRIDGAPEVLDPDQVDEVAIAIPSATPPELRAIVEALEPTGIRLKVLPGIRDVLAGNGGPGQLRELRIQDLLGREPVSLDLPELARDLAGRTVLITGAAGSIGSELARQVAANRPGRLVLLDQAESDLYFVDLELRERHPELEVIPVVADILDRGRLREVFEEHRPHRVYHAAAYKHVPLMERNPREALRNNVVGTWHVAAQAAAHGAGSVVLISTDKAADPACVMGATKRAAELVIQYHQDHHPEMRFTAVRFGNVLGSNGSVIPLFQRQIRAGGPITITDPEVTRYFMTIPEAVQLVLQAGLLKEARGEVVMLEMGESVKIVDLARNLVRLAGLRPEVDIPFVYTGLRPGEKLHESLQGIRELVRPTSLEGVRILTPVSEEAAPGAVEALVVEARDSAMDTARALELLHALVPLEVPEPALLLEA